MEHVTNKAFRHRLAALVGAGALALLGVAAVAAPAHADTNGGNVPAGPYTLNLTKLANPAAGGTATNGTQQDVSALTAIPGVDYSIAPVTGVDLTTQAGWTTAATLTVNAAGDIVDGSGNTYTTGAGTALPTTDANGLTSYTTSTPAVYEVTETSAPAGTQIAQPFLVALPLPQSNNWLTNVYVYPKNTVEGAPVKTVDDSAAHGVGDTVNWTVKSTVPNQTADNPLTQFSIGDALDSRLTPPAAGDVTVSLAASDGTAITLPAADYTVDVTGQNVTVTFTAAGLALLTAHGSSVVTVGIPTVVNSVGDGTIQNTALQTTQTQNQENAGTPPTTTPTNTPQTTFGNLTLHKVDPNGGNLAGAEFQVFTSTGDASTLSNPVSVSGVSTFTSAADGLVAINGLKAQDDGQGVNLNYWLVETKAPAGYSVAPSFAQSAGGFEVSVAPGSANAVVTVTDPQVNPILLPLTGSTGTTIFLGGGLTLAALAAVAAVLLVRRRRSEQALVMDEAAK
jgi:fimbrial isopeptide formation D2 family protein/LPXTG-motif cell wall-anchored protein